MSEGLPVGAFCWFNILTPEPALARDFFSRLLGWTFAATGMGHTVTVNGRAVGGLFDLAGPGTPKGTPPVVGLMLKVQSADRAAERVVALGGHARPAFDVGGAGRMSVCHDPSGAEFDVWEPKALLGWDIDPATPGAPSWFEVGATDVDLAVDFYRALCGWTVEALAPERRVFQLGGRPIAGVTQASSLGPPPRWATHFAVPDAAATLREAAGLGGTVIAPLTEVDGTPVAGLCSPHGVPFHVMQRKA